MDLSPSSFADRLIHWYRIHQRALPWRASADPYKIWLSEVILQQTRVSQGLPYYLRFIAQFPTVRLLAAASQEDVLRLWQGLGYYSRARNMHRCAQEIVEYYGGVFPNTYEGLRGLPGVGNYTAAAISSIAFRLPHAVVDGNVYRVLSRVFGIGMDINTARGKKYIESKAYALIDRQRPGEYNQAIMEFGALHCRPKNPDCASCIFHADCVAFQHSDPLLFPKKSARVAIQKRYITYFFLMRGEYVALRKRDQKDIWEGLYDCYAVESTRAQHLGRVLASTPFLNRLASEALHRKDEPLVKHVLSHRLILARFIFLKLPATLGDEVFTEQGLTLHSLAQLDRLPKSALLVRYLERIGILDA